MTDTETPRTELAISGWNKCGLSPAQRYTAALNLCGALERELADAQATIEKLMSVLRDYEAAHPFGRLGEAAREVLGEGRGQER